MPSALRYEFRSVAACNMCRSTSLKMLGMRLSASQGVRPTSAEGIAVPVKQCCECGLIFAGLQPVPEDLSDHYGIPPEDYWRSVPAWEPSYFASQIEDAKRLLHFRPGMTALDVGAGIGSAMKSLSVAGFDTWGFEPSEPFRDFAIKQGIIPHRIQRAPIETAAYVPKSFDFITFGAVLEHLFDPRAAIETAMEWLKPGGIMHVEVPSSDWLIPKLVNAFFRMRGTNYVTHISPMHSPFHLYEFTLRSFRDFKVVESRIDVCEVMHIPRPLKPALRWWMRQRGSGMQLTVYLRRPASE